MWWLALASAAEIRGMTVSTPTWGWEWGSPQMASTLDVLDGLGVNWVATHPYAGIRQDGSVLVRNPPVPGAAPDWLVRPVREAHARGQKVMLVPHLAHWGSGFAWRGDIHFDDPADRARFFYAYTQWVVGLARAAPDVDAFVVGSELDGTIMHEAEWRAVIAAVRTVYAGPITYAANWDRAEQVPFWDALDAVGIQAYYPLVEATSGVPDDAALDAGWARAMQRVRALHERTGKYVVFTELGYDTGDQAPREPWASGSGTQGSQLQQRCLRAALRALDREPAVVGAFLWKWFPGEAAHGDFRMSDPALQAVIAESWRPTGGG
jgi:hypothetical protein